MMKFLSLVSLTFSLTLTACTADVPGYGYEDVPDEPALTGDEKAVLPDNLGAEHADDLQAALAQEIPEDDATTFDNDVAHGIVEQEVDDTPPQGAVTAISYAALLHYGLHPRASDGLRNAGVAAWRITQTIGSAPASAGTHARDGYANGQPYSAATDISVTGLTNAQIVNLLEKLAKEGFAAYYRHTGQDGWNGVNHIHAVYANCAMKASLRSQVRSWLVGRNGLVSNTIYTFHTFTAAAKATVKGKFAMSAEGTSNAGAGVSGRVSTDGTALNVRSTTALTGSVVTTIANGSYITITCQKHGGSVAGTYGTSTLWDKVGGGFVADAYVSTGSDGQVAPTCP